MVLPTKTVAVAVDCWSCVFVNTLHVMYCFILCSEWEKKRREWLLHEAQKFATDLLNNWDLGHCGETVIILYSVHDGVVSGTCV